MKKTLFLLLTCTLFIACKKELKTETGTFNWLVNNWERTNEAEGRETYEDWKRISLTEYAGSGYTLENGKRIFEETMRLFKTDTTWVLEVSGPNEQPISFTVTDYNAISFKAENPEHDFPKLIRYSIFDETLSALVSDGGEQQIQFSFWPVED